MTETERFLHGCGPDPHSWDLARDPMIAGRDAGKPPSPAEVRLAHSQRRPPPAGKGALSRPAYIPGGSHG